MKRLYFIRHGESEMNVSGLFAGITDTPLTEKGRKQAISAGKKIKNLDIDLIVASPLSRAYDTSRLIAQETGYPVEKILLNELFMERHYGKLEGQPYSLDLTAKDMLDAETSEVLLKRARLALTYLETLDAKTILVVSHGSFGRALRHHVLKDFPFTHPQRIPNAEIIQLL
ncbi:MAG: histidine phosphatase family protein [bacterium]|nr:histidine phosphatase family protein [bacterium]